MSTRSAEKLSLKQRRDAVLKRLPRFWTIYFIHRFPEYEQQTSFIKNIRFKRVTGDEAVISKMEQLADLLSPNSNKAA